jgi:hypothetical protein
MAADHAESGRHICGWSGPSWLHVKRLCATCKGQYPTVDAGRPLDFSQVYGPPCRTCWPYAMAPDGSPDA